MSAPAFAWTGDFERPWDLIEEGADGRLHVAGAKRAREAGARGRGGGGGGARAVQRGLLRNVLLVVDASEAASRRDFPAPTGARGAALLRAADAFAAAFLDANPISALGLLVARGGLVAKACELTGSAPRVRAALAAALGPAAPPPAGAFSFEHAVRGATRLLALHPPVAAREVVVLHASLASVDPGDVFAALRDAAAARVRVSVVSLAGEVYLAARAAAETGGAYAVPLGPGALLGALLAHCAPPPLRAADAAAARAAGPLAVGFPAALPEAEALCACHNALRSATFECPRCGARNCEVPAECAVCALRLLSAPALARTYHHIFPVPPFARGAAAPPAGAPCAGCAEPLARAAPPLACGACGLLFCDDCDATIHETLHTCPGCA